MSERRKPFVAWMREGAVGADEDRHYDSEILKRTPDHIYDVPVIVTPLEPSDPKVGETYTYNGFDVVVASAPFERDGELWVRVEYEDGDGGIIAPIALLAPPKPALKTYRLNYGGLGHLDFQAESIDDALAKIRESLEEVE